MTPSSRKNDGLITEGEVELYRRARELWRAPEPPPEAVAVAALSRFVELQHVAAATADAAAHRALNPDARQALSRLAEGEAVLARELGQAVRDYGGAPPEPAESQQELPCGPDAVAFAQTDGQIVHAVSEDLRELERLYLEAAESERTPEEVRSRFRNLAEVQRRARRELEAGV